MYLKFILNLKLSKALLLSAIYTILTMFLLLFMIPFDSMYSLYEVLFVPYIFHKSVQFNSFVSLFVFETIKVIFLMDWILFILKQNDFFMEKLIDTYKSKISKRYLNNWNVENIDIFVEESFINGKTIYEIKSSFLVFEKTNNSNIVGTIVKKEFSETYSGNNVKKYIGKITFDLKVKQLSFLENLLSNSTDSYTYIPTIKEYEFNNYTIYKDDKSALLSAVFTLKTDNDMFRPLVPKSLNYLSRVSFFDFSKAGEYNYGMFNDGKDYAVSEIPNGYKNALFGFCLSELNNSMKSANKLYNETVYDIVKHNIKKDTVKDRNSNNKNANINIKYK